jgi:AraC-like DNA-binding protein
MRITFYILKEVSMPYITDTKLNKGDLNIYQWGTEKCQARHHYGPAVRDHYLIHYIMEGSGKFEVEDRSYTLKKGQGFLICPGIITYYQASFDTPWHYSWVGFQGKMATKYLSLAGLDQKNPIFLYNKDSYIKDCLDKMNSISQFKPHSELKVTGLLYLFLYKLIENNSSNNVIEPQNRKELYVQKAVEFIEKNYSRKITISYLAKYIGINRKYLYALFKEFLNTSPKQFLLQYRMDKACELMEHTSLSIGDISRSVGYEDPLLFSKMFKNIKGMSPSNYRNKLNS